MSRYKSPQQFAKIRDDNRILQEKLDSMTRVCERVKLENAGLKEVCNDLRARIAELEAAHMKTACICGSMRFRQMMEQCAQELTLSGWIVVMPHVFKLHVPEECAASLDALHLKKIDMAQKVVIVSKDGYMGKSTRHEYDYAKDRGKIIEFYDKPIMRDLPPMPERSGTGLYETDWERDA